MVPFPIQQVINPVAVKLLLPADFQMHPVFHVSLVRPYNVHVRSENPPPSMKVGRHFDFEAHKILDSKCIEGRLVYLSDWKGYGSEDQS